MQYRKTKEALERITTTSIKSKGTFYNKERKEWIEDVFHLYERIAFKGKKLPDGEIADTNYLFLGSWYLQSLKSKIASRLYEILGVKFYGSRNKRENFICYRYSKLCQLLPITPFKQMSRAKQQLNPAHDELKKTEFLSDYQWDKKSGKDWLVYHWPGERAKKEMRKIKTKKEFFELPPGEEGFLKPEKPRILSKSQTNLVNQLVSLNVSKVTAQDLVKHSSQQAIRRWIKRDPLYQSRR